MLTNDQNRMQKHLKIPSGFKRGFPKKKSFLNDSQDTTTGEWDNDAVDNLPFGRSALGCLRTVVDGVEGIMVTGGCIDGCLVGGFLHEIFKKSFFEYYFLYLFICCFCAFGG